MVLPLYLVEDKAFSVQLLNSYTLFFDLIVSPPMV